MFAPSATISRAIDAHVAGSVDSPITLAMMGTPIPRRRYSSSSPKSRLQRFFTFSASPKRPIWWKGGRPRAAIIRRAGCIRDPSEPGKDRIHGVQTAPAPAST